MKFFYLIIFFILFLSGNISGMDYDGNHLLIILGKDKSSLEFKEFNETWKLDKELKNSRNGIRVYANDMSGKIESILFAGESFIADGAKFSRYSSKLPFGVSLYDDVESLTYKLGNPQKLAGRNTLKFHHQNAAIEITYANATNREISSVKIYSEVSNFVPPAKALAMAPDRKMTQEGPQQKIVSAAPPGHIMKMEEKLSAFKRAILEVFRAYRESAFYAIKGSSRPVNNFWNYKYTYDTSLKIPGEKYNMLYSFPFTNSTLDFVSVIKESDTYDKSLDTTYREFEKKLMENFPQKDGWVASCIPNKESKSIPDIELRNDRFGAIVLDYSKNPKGKHILYLRFLLFS